MDSTAWAQKYVQREGGEDGNFDIWELIIFGKSNVGLFFFNSTGHRLLGPAVALPALHLSPREDAVQVPGLLLQRRRQGEQEQRAPRRRRPGIKHDKSGALGSCWPRGITFTNKKTYKCIISIYDFFFLLPAHVSNVRCFMLQEIYLLPNLLAFLSHWRRKFHPRYVIFFWP